MSLYTYGFRRLRLFSEAAQRIASGGFEDLLVSQLNAEVGELISRGLHRNYIGRQERLASPRGRIDIQRIANDGGVTSATLPCVYHPRIEDTLLNRMLLAGLLLAAGVASDLRLRREARRLASSFEESVSPIVLNGTNLDRASHRLNRLTRAYESAISIIRLLCESQGVSFVGSESTFRVPGFLFDMNKFFQALVSRFLNDNLSGYIVRDEYRLRDMMHFDPKFNPRKRRAPTPRPDFVVMDGSTVVSILDAKYRDLWEKPLPREMLYQLAVYATSHKQQVATILYPTLDEPATEARIDVRDSVYAKGIAQVRLRPVVLGKIENLIMTGRSVASQRKRKTYARWLAFGI